MSAPLSLLDALAAIPDPRDRRGIRHPLPAILSLAVLAMLTGCKTLAAIAQFGRDKGFPLAHALGFRRGKTPTKSTFSILFRSLDIVAFESVLQHWVQCRLALTTIADPTADPTASASTNPASATDSAATDSAATDSAATDSAATDSAAELVVALDGKTLRGSRNAEVPGVHLVAAYAVQAQAVLTQIRVDAKTNEHKAALQLLGLLPLAGVIVTGDALFCQRDVCRTIVDHGGDYLFFVKDNQPGLLADIGGSFGYEASRRSIAAATAALSP